MKEHIDDILNSDLLERFVLGDVTIQERQKVDLLRIEHRAIREKITALEKAFSKVDGNDPKSSKDSRECIVKNISGSNVKAAAPPTFNLTPQSILSMWKYVAALLIGGFATWAFMQHQLSSSNELIIEQEAELAQLQSDCDFLNKQYAFINHTSSIPYLLDGKAFSKESQVVIYWNEQLEKSMLRVVELPAISSDQTYQLWADVEGRMLSLGTFDAGQAITDAIPMNYLSRASSLNITVESRGGSEHPTVANLTASVSI